jgi:leader peptidase (prepilin peptidase)/N-methyltransferase
MPALTIVAAAAIGLGAGWFMRRVVATESGSVVNPALVTVATGALSAAAAWRFGASWELPVYLYFAIVSVPLAIIDLRTHRLPNPLTLSAYPIVLIGLALPSIIDGRWGDFGRGLLAGLAALAVFALLHVINPSGMGLGDVKLAGSMGALLGWLSWSSLIVGLFLGFALAAIVGLALLATGRAGRKSAMPFGPFMLVGAWFAILVSSSSSVLGWLGPA